MSAPELIAALQDAARFPHPVTRFALHETHASWVLLTGPFAYKIKKPVDFGFLDFSTLDKRRRACNEELRLNRRLAGDLYRDVVPITGSATDPRIGGDGETLEYAVRMTEFPQAALLDGVLARGELTPAHVDALAARVAAFHAAAPVAPPKAPFGEPDLVFRPLRDNFVALEAHLADHAELTRLAALRGWSIANFDTLRDLLTTRRVDGCIRECHGDLHLGNLLLLDGQPTPFDCIEFNPGLRWIDVLSDLAFLSMDLVEHGAEAYAWRLVNRYLELSGDYAGAPLLAFYQVYRALVRAKVAALRAAQEGHDNEAVHDYLAFAERLAAPRRPWLLLMHGLSGSGKSHVSGLLLERLGAYRVRSDVERKRLAGLPTHEPSPAGRRDGLYAPAMGERTYARLEELATGLLDAGLPAIVDAASLQRAERDRFRDLAAARGVPFAVVSIEADAATLAARLDARTGDDDEPSDADAVVLGKQRGFAEPLADDERARAVVVRGDWSGAHEAALATLGVASGPA